MNGSDHDVDDLGMCADYTCRTCHSTEREVDAFLALPLYVQQPQSAAHAPAWGSGEVKVALGATPFRPHPC